MKANLVIFQDPREDKQAFNSVRIVQKTVENLQVLVRTTQRGRKFNEIQFKNPVLVYPSKNASVIVPDVVDTIILIDATWTFAKSLYNKNEWISRIPTVILQPVRKPIYSPLRKPPKEGLVSTAEALIIILEGVGDIESADVLRKALQAAVDAEPWQNKVFKEKYEGVIDKISD